MKFVCQVCGYVYEGEAAPEVCPICKAPASKFTVVNENEKTWAAEHVVGVAKGAPEDIIKDLRANFEGECSEVGMYLAMARVASRFRAFARLARSNLPAVAPFSASTLISRFFLVESVTTSPRSSANLDACSASSKAAFSQ